MTNSPRQGSGTATGGSTIYHALLWNSAAASVIDLNPAGFTSSVAWSISGTQQVGEGLNNSTGENEALLWSGSAGSAVDLNPAGFTGSDAIGTILVKYTYYGDANLDGKVDGSDYARIDNGYLNLLTGWFNGDFNYDGVINGSDYALIDNAFNTQGASLAASISSIAAFATAQIATPSSQHVKVSQRATTICQNPPHRKKMVALTEILSGTEVFQSNAPISFSESSPQDFELSMQKKDVLDALSS